MKPEDVVLCATNTSEFWDLHMKLARNGVHLDYWKRHIVRKVMPAYRKAEHEPYDGMTLEDIEEAAQELKAYYIERAMEEIKAEVERKKQEAK